MELRPEAIGVVSGEVDSRGHPEVSLDPQCMQPLSYRHCLPNNVAPYWSQTPSRQNMRER